MIQYIYNYIYSSINSFFDYIKVNHLYYCKNCKKQKVDNLFGICIYCEIDNEPNFYNEIL